MNSPLPTTSAASLSRPRIAFITITDYDFFTGTLATVNSILHFCPMVEVIAVNNLRKPLSDPQRKLLEAGGVRVLDSDRFDQPGRFIGPWELKAYAACDLASDYELIVGIDSDCILCAPLDDVLRDVLMTGHFCGGKDGSGVTYDESYAPYGIKSGSRNERYMSTSLYFCPVNETNKRILTRWAECVGQAVFNGKGNFPGHGDQGVLNGVLFADSCSRTVDLLENQLWSQHWTYWNDVIVYEAREFRNYSHQRKAQRSFHCGGAEKFWAKAHSDKIYSSQSSQGTNYAWWLYQFWFGKCSDWSIDPAQYIPSQNLHLCRDLVNFFAQMRKFDPGISLWKPSSDGLLSRLVADIRGCMNFGGSMEDYLTVVRALPDGAKVVEVGSCEGRSIVSLALGCMDRDFTFYSVESFTGDLNNTFDGHALPLYRTLSPQRTRTLPFPKNQLCLRKIRGSQPSLRRWHSGCGLR